MGDYLKKDKKIANQNYTWKLYNSEVSIMLIKLAEETQGTHIYMRMRLESGRIEEIDVYITEEGIKYHTTADNISPEIRKEIIEAFNKLY